MKKLPTNTSKPIQYILTPEGVGILNTPPYQNLLGTLWITEVVKQVWSVFDPSTLSIYEKFPGRLKTWDVAESEFGLYLDFIVNVLNFSFH